MPGLVSWSALALPAAAVLLLRRAVVALLVRCASHALLLRYSCAALRSFLLHCIALRCAEVCCAALAPLRAVVLLH